METCSVALHMLHPATKRYKSEYQNFVSVKILSPLFSVSGNFLCISGVCILAWPNCRSNWGEAHCPAEAGNNQFIGFGWLTPMAIENLRYF